MSGTEPGIALRVESFLVPFGMQFSKAFAYGCIGLEKKSWTSASSAICPAYITTTLSAT